MGTIGGSVAHADPAADYPAVLQALRAQVRLVGRKGERTVAIDDFLVDAFTTALGEGEILTEVIVPADPAGAGSAYHKLQQPASGFSVCGVAAQLGVSGGTISHARVGVTGVAARAYVAKGVEEALVGRPANAATLAEAARRAADGVEALSDLFAAPDYRAHLAQVEARRALEAALAGAR
jgi:carbon-monoxide dehydrogenase medium subunit